MKEKVRVLVVDDSSVIRHAIGNILDSSEEIRVVGEARNGKEALDLIPSIDPDVVTLDVIMPGMNGLAVLKHIMIRYPRPVVMCSALTKAGASMTFEALKYGAVDFIHKPRGGKTDGMEEQFNTIIHKILIANEVEIGAARRVKNKLGNNSKQEEKPECRYVCGIGASEGGYASLLKIIPQLRPDLAISFIAVLHNPRQHVDAFIEYLGKNSGIDVRKAKDGELLRGGTCYIGTGEEYITCYQSMGDHYLSVTDSPFPNRRGAINMLMISMAEVLKDRALGLILSGAGNDGVEGMEEIMRMGGYSYVQDPKTCLFKETPSLVIQNCEIDYIVSDNDIAGMLNENWIDK